MQEQEQQAAGQVGAVVMACDCTLLAGVVKAPHAGLKLGRVLW